MAKSGPTGQLPGRLSEKAMRTRALLVGAAIDALISDGFAGASARNIAQRAKVNQALVFYHFGSVTDLLLAALDEVSALRLGEYGRAVATAATPSDLVDVASRVYEHDLTNGYVKVLVEMIAGSSTSPELRAAVAARIGPWYAFTRDAVDAAVSSTPFASAVPTSDVAYAVVALFLGLELLTHLDGDVARETSLFAHAKGVAALLTTAPITTEVSP